MKLVMPTLNYKDKAIEFIKEFFMLARMTG